MAATRGSEATAAVDKGAVSARREELLAIAAGLFASRGYVATTVRDIADEAGILSGSLYHHFSSKEAMLDEILRGFLTTLVERFVAVQNSPNEPKDKLADLVMVAFETINTNPNAVSIYQNEANKLSQQAGFEYLIKLGKQFEDIWIKILCHGQDSGQFRKDIDPKIAYQFICDTVWMAVRWYRPSGEHSHRAVADQYLGILFDGLVTHGNTSAPSAR